MKGDMYSVRFQKGIFFVGYTLSPSEKRACNSHNNCTNIEILLKIVT